MAKSEIFDPRICQLGESPLWHPMRHELFWVDVKTKRLLSRSAEATYVWTFTQTPSALGWIDEFRLLIANNTGLIIFDLRTEEIIQLCAIEADQPQTRSNDGRADPWGGFWVGTMNDNEALPPAGVIYRWYKGELRQVATDFIVPNGICFDHTRSIAYFADSPRHKMWRQALDPVTGWPVGDAEIFMDHTTSGLIMDGAIVDAEGCLWVALWDSAKVAKFSPAGQLMEALETQTTRPTCPAFGGPDASDLYVTTAAIGLEGQTSRGLTNGSTLVYKMSVQGVPAPSVNLGV